MKLTLEEVTKKINREIGRLSPIISTEQVIRNKFSLARMRKVTGHLKVQKRRSYDSWRKLLLLTNCLVKKA